MNSPLSILQQDALDLLKELIATPSFSKEEDKTAGIINSFLEKKGIKTQRAGNNILALNLDYDPRKPTILLNSHHDTVKPNSQYTRDPFYPVIEKGKLFGLGSNDAGGCLVCLIAAFIHFYHHPDLKYNLALAATAEEEISGNGGIELALQSLPAIDSGIVGEPTQLQMAVAEKGLMVLDAVAYGKAGHAARDEGENAIYKALKDIDWFQSQPFPRVSDLLGPVKITVTVIETENKAHNVVPAICKFIIDIRVNELYTFDEILDTIQKNVQSEVKARSKRLRSSSIALDHPLVKAGLNLGRSYFGSPTISDKALMNFPAVKIGPGDSARSHTADEFIYMEEIKTGIEFYIELLNQLL